MVGGRAYNVLRMTTAYILTNPKIFNTNVPQKHKKLLMNVHL